MSALLPAACPAGGTPVWEGWTKRACETEVMVVRDCTLVSPVCSVDGRYADRPPEQYYNTNLRMVITEHRLVFDESKSGDWSQLRGGQWLLGVEEVKLAKDLPDWAAGISVRCRDLAMYVVLVKARQKHEIEKAMQRISKGRAPLSDRSCFSHPESSCFYSHPHMGATRTKEPFRYNASVELERLQKGLKGQFRDQFRVSRCNVGFKVCASYPEEVIVPYRLADDIIGCNAKFRSKSRFPMVAWFNPATGACLARCSQPALGVGGKVAEYTQSIAGAVTGLRGKMANVFGIDTEDSKSSPRSDKLMDYDEGDRVIIGLFATQRSDKKRVLSGGREVRLTIADARPSVNAGANTLKGGGTEGAAFHDCELTFLNIDNIHVMRQSLQEFRKCMAQPQGEVGKAMWNGYSERLEKCSWFGHLELVLQGAVFCAKRILAEESVVVHCSDGWDRTSQLVCLTTVLIDPYFRTIEGFVVCVEKDWLQPGHKFADRNGLHDANARKDGEESPVFLQFLECLAHLADRHPRAFEYTPAFLGFILDESYSGDNINFLGNNVSDRTKTARPGRCIWREILSTPQAEREKRRWLNPLFVPPQGPAPLLEIPRPESFVFQHPLYGRWRQAVEPQLPPPLPVLLLEEIFRLRSEADRSEADRRAPSPARKRGEAILPDSPRTKHSDAAAAAASDSPPSPSRVMRTKKS